MYLLQIDRFVIDPVIIISGEIDEWKGFDPYFGENVNIFRVI